jgi:tartrate dehydratase alpha subunit/fumarate hydratase class I-like protein
MKYRSLERIIKEVVHGLPVKSGYKSLEHSIRNVMEKNFHDIEVDYNDQIVAGTYRTKHFERSEDAQKLYTNLPKNTDPIKAEQAAILQDKLFGIHKDVATKKRATEADVRTANELSDKIKKVAKDLKLENEHSYIDRIVQDINAHLDTSGEVMNVNTLDNEKITNRMKSPPYDKTKEIFDNDIDNSKFVIGRSIKAQRKLKIIDND